jgi:hypothetical protein
MKVARIHCMHCVPRSDVVIGVGGLKAGGRLVGPVSWLTICLILNTFCVHFSIVVFTVLQVRVSELKEIVCYRGSPPPAALPNGEEQHLQTEHRSSQPTSPAAAEVAGSPKVAEAAKSTDGQLFRAAVSNLSLCIDQGGEEKTPSSSPQASLHSSSVAPTRDVRIASATRQLLRTASYEDGFGCTLFNAPCIAVFLMNICHQVWARGSRGNRGFVPPARCRPQIGRWQA